MTPPADPVGQGRPRAALAVLGATASGKSAVALALARARPEVDLVSLDAMAVYRGMDIGTAKPTPAERREGRYRGLDLFEPCESVTVVDVRDAVDDAVADIAASGHHAVLVGGSGLHLRAVIDGLEPPGEWPALRAELEATPPERTAELHARLAQLDPVAAARMEPTNTRRVVRALEVTLGSGRPFSSFGPGLDVYPAVPTVQIGLRWPRAVLAERIAGRVHAMVAAGFVDEVARLAARPGGFGRTAAPALGYREMLDHLAGRGSLAEAIEATIVRTRQFAARQDRWFRRDPRIRWVELTAGDNPLDALGVLLEALPPT